MTDAGFIEFDWKAVDAAMADLAETDPYEGNGYSKQKEMPEDPDPDPEAKVVKKHGRSGQPGYREFYHPGTAITNRTSPGDFHEKFENALDGNPLTNHVTHYSESDLAGMELIMTGDGLTGVAIHDHGDGRIEATALFNVSPTKGMGSELLRYTVNEWGVNYVEAFGPVLPDLYSRVGFSEVDVYEFDPVQAPDGWDTDTFDSPQYHIMTIGGKNVAKAAEGSVDWNKMRDRCIEKMGVEWWDQYGEASLLAAMALSGEVSFDEVGTKIKALAGGGR